MTIEDLRNSPFSEVVKRYLDEEMSKLADLSTIKGTSEDKGRIVEGRQEATKILTKLFKFLDYKPSKGTLKNQYK
jgi:hypothetical protein